MKKKRWLWLFGGVGMPALGCGVPFFVVIMAVMIFIGGVGAGLSNLFGSHNTPPSIATPNSRPMEWLATASAISQSDGMPNTVAMAVIQQASDGEAFAERYYCSNNATYGEPCNVAQPHQHGIHNVGVGEGLVGLNTRDVAKPSGTQWQSVQWNLSTGLQHLARDLHAGYWTTALSAFHAHVQAPPGWHSTSHYADDIRSLVERYNSAPTLGAWAVASWDPKSGRWSDPHDKPETVMVVGAAPTGPKWQGPWSPPTVSCAAPAAHSSKPAKCHTVYHLLQGHALEAPIQVWGQLKNGTTVSFHINAASARSPLPGSTIYSASVPLHGPHALTAIYASWGTGVQDNIPWPEVAGGGGPNGIGSPGPISVITNQQALNTWWSQIQVAHAQTGASADLIAAVMIHESGGNAGAYNPSGPAYGLMQILQSTAVGLPGYNPATWTQSQQNLILGGELLEQNFRDTGGVSWREAIAAYYAGLGRMEKWGFRPGMSWAQAAPILDRVPAAWADNTETASGYAEQMKAEMTWVATHAP